MLRASIALCAVTVLALVGACERGSDGPADDGSGGAPSEQPAAQPTGAATAEQRCDEGDATSCAELANAIDDMTLDSFDLVRAVELHAIACDGGISPSCEDLNVLSDLVLTGTPAFEANVERAVELRWIACDNGQDVACVDLVDDCSLLPEYPTTVCIRRLGQLCDDGRGTPCEALALQAQHMFLRSLMAARINYACDSGDLTACANEQRHFNAGAWDIAPNPLLRAACELGGHDACSELADNLIWEGDLELQTEIPELVSGPCDRGHVRSCGLLGWALYDGVGIEPDLERGEQLMRDACAEEHLASCRRLGERGM